MIETPDKIYGELFKAVQLSGIFPDSKTFVDMVPNHQPAQILESYHTAKQQTGFDLKGFVKEHFTPATISGREFTSDTTLSVAEHIFRLWPYLTRQADEPVAGSSLIPLPHPYIVPGGRFKEIYYWDSYFTMLGLAVDGKLDMVENMVKNFAHLIKTVGHIPNGNRSYFYSRSQPPFFALMVDLLAGHMGDEILAHYISELQIEYDFWMRSTSERVVEVAGFRLNRYWDSSDLPRQESYAEDVEIKGEEGADIYRHLRAACESGWDFSSRWFTHKHRLDTICAMDILPVDLNALLYFLEATLGKAHLQIGNESLAAQYHASAEQRKEAINALFFNQSKGYYADYWWTKGEISDQPTLAMMFPLFFKIADYEKAASVAAIVERQFLKAGGVVTSLVESGQQWDFPNGWPPLQWVTVVGLHNYGFTSLAKEIARRWLRLNDKVFKNTGKMMEKYNVVDDSLQAGGGEYPVQDGFGWTNGVYLALKQFLEVKITSK